MDGLVWPQQRQQPSLLTVDVRSPNFVSSLSRASNRGTPHIRQFLHDIRPVRNKYSPVAKQGIRTAAFFRRDSAWNGEYFAAEIAGISGCHERTRPLARLHDDDTQGQTGQGPVTGRKVVRKRRRAGWELGQDSASVFYLAHEPRVLGWVDDVDTAPEDGARASLRRQGAPVGGRVDSPSEAADDRHAASSEIESELLGHLQSIRARPTRSHDRDSQRVAGHDLAAHVKARRRP